MAAQKLNEQEITAAVARLPGWSVKDGKLHRSFVCKNFVHAWGFMSSVALEAEAMNHHPDWSNSWNKVEIDLVTHSAGGITTNDVRLAEKIHQIFGTPDERR